MTWTLSTCGATAALRFAAPHYSRRKNADAAKLGGPAEQLVLTSGDPVRALWMSTVQRPEWVKHAWPGAWLNSLFRNDGGGLASELIRSAVAVTRWRFGEPPALGMVTFIDSAEVRPTMRRGVATWGYCYLRAGFIAEKDTTGGGLLVFRLLPDAMPEPEMPIGASPSLWSAA